MTMKDDNLKGYIQAGRYAEDNNTTLLVILELIYRGDMPAVKKNDGKWYVIKDFPFPLSKCTHKKIIGNDKTISGNEPCRSCYGYLF